MLPACPLGAAGDGIRQYTATGNNIFVVVSEGKSEPRSIGSYSLRIYSAHRPEFPFDNFITGLIRPRDGAVEKIFFEDLNADGQEEIIITIRSVGTGSYLSADAFSWDQKILTFFNSVEGPAPDVNFMEALRNTQHLKESDTSSGQ